MNDSDRGNAHEDMTVELKRLRLQNWLGSTLNWLTRDRNTKAAASVPAT